MPTTRLLMLLPFLLAPELPHLSVRWRIYTWHQWHARHIHRRRRTRREWQPHLTINRRKTRGVWERREKWRIRAMSRC
ncbi:hypothetical protein BKA64DRAFT_665196 [Cadophora sp. MPI-SDFR-AT-0126]|nr:hypothetical protein BKA64DRAFT_665196 [Leotiomycetes sp. MPI-SDFR-AT-0126]